MWSRKLNAAGAGISANARSPTYPAAQDNFACSLTKVLSLSALFPRSVFASSPTNGRTDGRTSREEAERASESVFLRFAEQSSQFLYRRIAAAAAAATAFNIVRPAPGWMAASNLRRSIELGERS